MYDSYRYLLTNAAIATFAARGAPYGLVEAGARAVEAGKRADFAIWNVATPAELAYRNGFNPLVKRVRGRAADQPGETT
ncbi:MAG: hypothetical protein AAF458_03330 [Pseudomonadota bacterium]